MNVRAFILTSALILGLGSSTRADFAYSFADSGSANLTFGQNATYGFRFTPVVNITVDSLGFYDFGQDGLVANHRVGIWTSGGALLASTTVTNATSTLGGPVVLGGQFRYTSITGLNLLAGVTYTLGAGIEGAQDRYYSRILNISNAPSLVTVLSPGVFTINGFAFPDRVAISPNTYAAGSFTAFETAAAVPEPASMALLGLGVASIGLLSRTRLKSARKSA